MTKSEQAVVKKTLRISFSQPCKPLFSCPAVLVLESKGCYPVVYFKKPKNAPQKEYEGVVEAIRFLLNADSDPIDEEAKMR